MATKAEHNAVRHGPTTRCPQCNYRHTGPRDTLCAVCTAQTPTVRVDEQADPVLDAGVLAAVREGVTAEDASRLPLLVRGPWLPLPPTLEAMGAVDPSADIPLPAAWTDEAHEALPAPRATRRPLVPTPEPPAPETSSWHTPRPCAYEGCGEVFTPKSRTQRFHTLRCSALWKTAQGGLQKMREGHGRHFQVHGDFALLARVHLATLTQQHATVMAQAERVWRQIQALEAFLAQEDGGKDHHAYPTAP